MSDFEYVRQRRLGLTIALWVSLACATAAFSGVLKGYPVAWAFVAPFVIVALLIRAKLAKPAAVFLREREQRRGFERRHPVLVAMSYWLPAIYGAAALIRYLIR